MIVYWAPLVKDNFVMSYLDQNEPDRVLSQINKKYSYITNDGSSFHNFRLCPAFVDNFKNTYAIRFTHDYEVEIKDDMIWSDVLDEEFFKSQMRYRSDDKRFLGFNLFYYFFCEEPLTMSLTPSYFDDNEFNKSSIIIPGVYDIGKWFRPIECSFLLRDNENKVVMKKGDAYSYVHFHTDEKIKFKRFHATNEIVDLGINFIRYHKKVVKPTMSLIPFYDAFARANMRKLVLKKIKENLLD